MVFLRSSREIELIRRACRIVKLALLLAEEMVRPGVSTEEIDHALEIFIRRAGGRPAFKGYRGYPAATCLSLNEVVVHGIPGSRRLEEGDILGVDVGVEKEGYFGDGARTFPVGRVCEEAQRLVQATREAFFKGVEAIYGEGSRVSDISSAIESHVRSYGFSTVRALCGHGIGAALHEDPEVPNYGPPGRGAKLEPGMVLAIEPMVNSCGYDVETLEDGWTVMTQDRRRSAHYENTVAVVSGGVEILSF
jgi:methionyl aminopeptidase